MKAEARFQAMVENASDVISILDADTRILYESPSVTRLFGYTPEELLGRIALDFIHPDDRAKTMALFQTLLDHPGETKTHAMRFRSRDGSWKYLEVSARNLLNDPAVRGIVTNSRDITRRWKAEEALRHSEERFRLAAMATQEAIWEENIVSGERTWTGNFFKFFSFEPKDVENTHDWWMERIIPRDRTRVQASFLATMESSSGLWTEEYDFICGDKTVKTVIDRAYVQYDGTGNPVRTVGAMTDVTDKKRMEAQLRQVQRLESVGVLASGIAHDLNNILAPIQLAADLLQAGSLEDSALKLVKAISTSARRGGEIVKQVRTLARGSEGERTILQPTILVQKIQRILRESFPRNIDILAVVPQDIAPIKADATQLHQVLMSLCINGCDAMSHGGQIVIAATETDLDSTARNLHPDAKPGRYVVFAVSDTGGGIKPEIAAKIFDPFYTTKAAGQGTGLGLSMVMSIVKSHDGFVVVESEPGAGTMARVYLPVACADTIVAPKGPATRGIRGSGERILVVDDEETIRNMVQKALSKYGYQVILASNGEEATELLAQRVDQIQLVLTDIMMPVMDGISLIRIIRKQKPALPVIACSGFSYEKHQKSLRALDVHAFLEKPYSIAQLLDAVRDALPAPRLPE